MNDLIDNFHDWASANELEFPCTVNEYAARAAAFLQSSTSTGWNQQDFDTLMEKGVGPNWKEE